MVHLRGLCFVGRCSLLLPFQRRKVTKIGRKIDKTTANDSYWCKKALEYHSAKDGFSTLLQNNILKYAFSFEKRGEILRKVGRFKNNRLSLQNIQRRIRHCKCQALTSTAVIRDEVSLSTFQNSYGRTTSTHRHPLSHRRLDPKERRSSPIAHCAKHHIQV